MRSPSIKTLVGLVRARDNLRSWSLLPVQSWACSCMTTCSTRDSLIESSDRSHKLWHSSIVEIEQCLSVKAMFTFEYVGRSRSACADLEVRLQAVYGLWNSNDDIDELKRCSSDLLHSLSRNVNQFVSTSSSANELRRYFNGAESRLPSRSQFGKPSRELLRTASSLLLRLDTHRFHLNMSTMTATNTKQARRIHMVGA